VRTLHFAARMGRGEAHSHSLTKERLAIINGSVAAPRVYSGRALITRAQEGERKRVAKRNEGIAHSLAPRRKEKPAKDRKRFITTRPIPLLTSRSTVRPKSVRPRRPLSGIEDACPPARRKGEAPGRLLSAPEKDDGDDEENDDDDSIVNFFPRFPLLVRVRKGTANFPSPP